METLEVFIDGLKVQLRELAAKEVKNIPNKDEYVEGYAMGYATAIGNVIGKINLIQSEIKSNSK